MTLASPSPKPKLLKMRWVCGFCLNVIEEALDVNWVWQHDRGYKKSSIGRWEPESVKEPICHGHPMLVAGKAKLDIYGSGLMIDPVLNLRCPKIEAT